MAANKAVAVDAATHDFHSNMISSFRRRRRVPPSNGSCDSRRYTRSSNVSVAIHDFKDKPFSPATCAGGAREGGVKKTPRGTSARAERVGSLSIYNDGRPT